MLIVTTNTLPGYRVTAVQGEVFGLTVRSRDAVSNWSAGLQAIVGGELTGITQLLHETRLEAIARMQQEAAAKGANAILAFRFETNGYGEGYGIEVCAYGTAMTVEPLA